MERTRRKEIRKTSHSFEILKSLYPFSKMGQKFYILLKCFLFKLIQYLAMLDLETLGIITMPLVTAYFE